MAIDIDQSFYNTGTASVENGGTVVTGQGTQWISSIRANDIFGTHKGDGVRILSVESNTSLTLAYPWTGETQTTAPYEVQFTPYDTGYYPAVRQLLQTMASGNVEAFAGLVGQPDTIPMFTGAGAMTLVSRYEFGGGGGGWDVSVPDLAGLTAYEGEDVGYKVLVINNGTGRSAVYERQASGWSNPIYFTGRDGSAGPANNLTIGTVQSGDAPDVQISGTSPNQVLNFVLQKGDKGDTGDITPEAIAARDAAQAAASTATDAATTATDQAELATTARIGAETAKNLADNFANAPEGTEVEPGKYSAFHWSKVAETAAGGGISSVNGKTGSSITLDANDVGAIGELLEGDNITITGTGSSRTISSTSSPQVQVDWDATTGVSSILNKPTLGTAASSEATDFATSAQGTKADSSVQTVNGLAPTDGNVNVSSYRVPTKLGNIVILGSSTATGYGTSTYIDPPSAATDWMSNDKSWPYLLQQAIGSDGKIINRSIGGTNTTSSIGRFFTDVVPHNPNIVVLCTGWLNETGDNTSDRVANYINNTLELINLCRSIGAFPIVVCSQPLASSFIPEAQLDIARALDEYGIARWDFMLTAGDSTFNFRSGLAFDGAHGNDLAHEAYFSSIDIGILYNSDIKQNNRELLSTKKAKGFLVNSSTIAQSPISMVSNTYPCKSWTVYARLKAPLYESNKVGVPLHFQFLTPSSTITNPFRIRASSSNSNFTLSLYGTDEILINSNVLWDSPLPRDHIISYNHVTETIKYFIDGTLVGQNTASGIGANQLSKVLIGGPDSTDAASRLTGWVVEDFGLFRNDITANTDVLNRFLRGELNLGGCLIKPVKGVQPLNYISNTIANKAKVLTSNVGLTANPNETVFIRAVKSSAQTIPVGNSFVTIPFNSVTENIGGYYQSTTGKFTLPEGKYSVSTSVRYNTATGGATDPFAGVNIRNAAGLSLGITGGRNIFPSGVRENINVSIQINVPSGGGTYDIATFHTDTIERVIDSSNAGYVWLTINRVG